MTRVKYNHALAGRLRILKAQQITRAAKITVQPHSQRPRHREAAASGGREQQQALRPRKGRYKERAVAKGSRDPPGGQLPPGADALPLTAAQTHHRRFATGGPKPPLATRLQPTAPSTLPRSHSPGPSLTATSGRGSRCARRRL